MPDVTLDRLAKFGVDAWALFGEVFLCHAAKLGPIGPVSDARTVSNSHQIQAEASVATHFFKQK